MKTLLFLHIPKTAGSALVRALDRLFEPADRLRLYGRTDHQTMPPTEFPSLPLERRRQLRFVAGHFSYGLHELLPQPADYITVLREPVERVRSFYDHFRLKDQPGEGDWHNWITGERADLRRFVIEKPSRQTDNFMVRLLSGEATVPVGHCTRGMLDAAKRHLDTFALVMFQDDMEAGVVALSRLLGTNVPALRQVNVSERSEIPDETRALIAERNALDVALYEWARARS